MAGEINMSAFQSIKQGLTEAVAHAKGNQAGVNEYQPYKVDVAGLRKRLGLTQEQFAARFGFSSPPCAIGNAATGRRMARLWSC
jgi:DNA-binding transcriptional regulator YiaG